jgi:hypothetical protein
MQEGSATMELVHGIALRNRKLVIISSEDVLAFAKKQRRTSEMRIPKQVKVVQESTCEDNSLI